MKQEDNDFIFSVFRKQDEFFAALCYKYLGFVEKITGETDLKKLIKLSNTIDKYLELKEKDPKLFEFFKDKDPKYLEKALFRSLDKVLIHKETQERYIADGFSIEEIREKVKKYKAEKRAEEEKLKQK